MDQVFHQLPGILGGQKHDKTRQQERNMDGDEWSYIKFKEDQTHKKILLCQVKYGSMGC